MKTVYIVLIVIFLCLLGLGGAVAATYAKNKSNNDPDVVPVPGGAAGSSSGSVSTKALDQNKKLGIGSKGAEVKELQRLFNAGGGQPALVEDGVFGTKTMSAVIKVVGFGTVNTTLNAFAAAMKSYMKPVAGKSTQDNDASFLKKLFNL
jgi:peptidoglycan hydrolase-like protein with peptidoglycan-binding domain